MAGALDGITVVDLTEGIAGALATMLLCDNGARVIRLEYQGSERKRQTPEYAVWDRGKESVFFDLAAALQQAQADPDANVDRPADQTDLGQFHRLVAGCDVVIESFAPSSEYQNLVGYEGLIAVNPRLVHCSITAYGRDGPLRDRPADDDLVMAQLGILATQPSFRPGPVHVIHHLPSVAAGILAAQGVVAALYAREKTGSGRKVDTSLMAGALLYTPKVTGERMKRRASLRATAGGGPFYSAFECADGDWVQLACIHNGFVAKAATAMGIQDVLANPKFGDGRDIPTEEARVELFGIVAKVMKARPSREWEELFENADVPYGRACTAVEAMENPQVRTNEMVIELDDQKLGPMSQMGLPIKLSGTPGKVRGPRPVPGRHTKSVISGTARSRAPAGKTPDHSTTALRQPLDGVRVLETANVIAGPTAGKLLSDLGAEVIKMEPPAGDISRSAATPYFYLLNSNKRSVAVNARTEEGKDVAARLASTVDVLLANMRPGATDRIGIGSEALARLNPSIIEAHVTAFGWTGPYSHRAGLDPLAQALTGLQRAQGGPENPPVYLGALAPTDYVAGALGTLGTVMALFVRERTGVAQRVNTCLLNAAIVISSGDFVRYPGSPEGRFADKEQYGLGPLHRLYETGDGWIYLAAEGREHWGALGSMLGRDDLVADPRFESPDSRSENGAALATELGRVLRERTSAHWVKVLEDAGIPCAPVTDGYHEGFFSDPQAIANDMVVDLEHPVLASYKVSRSLVRFADTSDVDVLPTPLLGQHNEEVLQQVGYSPAEIEDLYSKEVALKESPG
jgi:crotonobetainyl-CoA:carnitine CoA-transferase CaiB-like acyl-CoA transferase